MTVPTYDMLFNPLIIALNNLGGSGSVEEIDNEVIKLLNLSEADTEELMPDGIRNKLTYRVAWARSYLKKVGILENTERSIWTFTEKGKDIKEVDGKEIKKFVSKLRKNKKEEIITEEDIKDELQWKDKLLKIIMEMPPDAFERLCQRILRESGFVQVDVLGKSGDGGIDGHGVIKIGGLLSFHVYFQSKRYKESVTSSNIRDFRGAMEGRADKGLLITTGFFTRDARKEALRDGAKPLDLIDGDDLVLLLKQFDLGVKTEKVENIIIDDKWFEKI